MPEKPLIAPTEPTSGSAGDKTKKADQDGGSTQSASSKAKPLDGVTSIDDKVFLECEILAYAALSKIAARIALESQEAFQTPAAAPAVGAAAPTCTIILLDDTLVSALQLFSALQLQLALLEKGFQGVAPAGPPPPKGLRLA